RFSHATGFERSIDRRRLVDVNGICLADESLESLFLDQNGVLSTWTRSKAYTPLSLVSVLKETPVASLVRVTIAPGTAAPLASCTVPPTRDVVPCPLATTTRQNTKNKNAQIGFLIFILGFSE